MTVLPLAVRYKLGLSKGHQDLVANACVLGYPSVFPNPQYFRKGISLD